MSLVITESHLGLIKLNIKPTTTRWYEHMNNIKTQSSKINAYLYFNNYSINNLNVGLAP